MKKILFLSTLFIGLLLTACNNKPAASTDAAPADTSKTTATDTSSNLKATTTSAPCHSTDTVDFTFSAASDITYCVDQVNGTISIFNQGNCMQTMQSGETHRWTVITKSGVLHFRDYSSSPSFNASYPTIYNAMDGDACDLALSSSSSGSCNYILIGTDDIRNDAASTCEEYRYKIFNSTSTTTFFVDIKIDTYVVNSVTKFRAVMKQSHQTSTSKPTTCTACDQNLCRVSASSSTPCP